MGKAKELVTFIEELPGKKAIVILSQEELKQAMTIAENSLTKCVILEVDQPIQVGEHTVFNRNKIA